MIARSAFFPAFVYGAIRIDNVNLRINVGKAGGEKGCGRGERVCCRCAGSLGRERRGIDGQCPKGDP